MSRLAPALLTLALPLALAGADAEPTALDVWPGDPPGKSQAVGPEKDTTTEKDNKIAGKRLVRLGNVSKPTLTVYRPKSKANGTAVVVCPGGAYRILAMDLEGTEVCEWLNTLGVTAVLLKYRVPASDAERLGPRQDAQRAVRLVRGKAKQWGIDPKRVGILGFSAGGHLAARTAYPADGKSLYERIDAIDDLDARPDFAVLVYPAYLTNAKKDALNGDVSVKADSPPAFLVHAKDDGVTYKSSELLAAALGAAKVPAEVHLYDKGGHGYGLRRTESPVTRWPEKCEAWLKGRKLSGE